MTNNLNLYKESIHNLTPLELTLKCQTRAIDFIEDCIEDLEKNDKINFVVNLNNALKILENFMYSLQVINLDGSTNHTVKKFFTLYEYITYTLRQGLVNFDTKDFDKCCDFLREIRSAYSNIKSTV